MVPYQACTLSHKLLHHMHTSLVDPSINCNQRGCLGFGTRLCICSLCVQSVKNADNNLPNSLHYVEIDKHDLTL